MRRSLEFFLVDMHIDEFVVFEGEDGVMFRMAGKAGTRLLGQRSVLFCSPAQTANTSITANRSSA